MTRWNAGGSLTQGVPDITLAAVWMRRGVEPVAVLFVLVLVSSWPALAAAQPAAAEQPAARPQQAAAEQEDDRAEETAEADIVPPKLAAPAPVDYPAGAQGEAVVVIQMTVTPDGSVSAPSVVAGEPPFAAAALEAARGWRFEPATRSGEPVSSIIRFKVVFTPPAPAPTQAPRAQDPKTQDPERAADREAAAPPELQPLEVLVIGERRPPGTRSFGKAEVRQLPGAFGDPFRAIEALPGVTPIISGLPFFYVRGAPPGNVGYYLDGVRVPYLYHIAIGPSVIHPAIVDRVDLYPGGYPARFGRFAGGIVAAETTEPRPELHGEANVRLFDAGAVAETGFADGRGTVLLGGRYSYTAALFSIFVPELTLDYRDFQARASYDVTSSDRLTLFGFGSFDLLRETKRGVTSTLFGSEFYRADLRYDHFFAEDSRLRVAATGGFDQTKISEQRNATDRIVGSRVELDHGLSQRVRLRSGTDVMVDSYGTAREVFADPDDPEPQQIERLFPAREDVAYGGYVDVVVDVTPRIEVTPGLRVDLFTQGSQSAVGVDPRIAGLFRISDDVRILHAYGIVHQPPSFVVPVPGISPATLEQGLQWSFQTSAGVEVDLPAKFTASATLFNNAFFNMTDALGTFSGDFDEINDRLEQRALGSSRGIELYVRRPLTEKLAGFVAYTLSRSTRSIGRESFPAAFDRTHVANGAVAYDLGKKWRAGARLTAYSGTPVQSPSDGFVVQPRQGSAGRSPPFYRVDLRLEKRWQIFDRGWLAFVVEVMNATLSKETFARDTGSTETIGPITIPSIGLEGGL